MVAVVIGVAAFLFVAVGQDAQLSEAAEALQTADREDGIPIAQTGAYEERLLEVQALTGASASQIVMYTLDAVHKLSVEVPETRRSALSILQSVVWVAETIPEDRRPLKVSEYFDRVIGRASGPLMSEDESAVGPAEQYMRPEPPGMWEYLPGQSREAQGEAYGYN